MCRSRRQLITNMVTNKNAVFYFHFYCFIGFVLFYSTTQGAIITCVDLSPDCALYGGDKICHGSFVPWSSVYCKQTCHFCVTDLPSTALSSTTAERQTTTPSNAVYTQPSTVSTENVVTNNSPGTTAKSDHRLSVRSICPSHVTQRVPTQYIHVYGDKCYEYVPTVGSWMHARTDCHSKGGHMLSITNAGEQAFILNLISKVYVIPKLWLGLDDRVNEGQYNWDSGATVNYTNWAPGRYVDPYHDQEDCVVMVVSRYGKWNDIDCNALVFGTLISYNWICQYNLETQVTNTTSDKPDGNWSPWQPWSACSATCGTGSQSRTRDCNNPAPQNGGNFCFGLRNESSTCNAKDCPHWMPFYEAAPCSVTCGVGFVQLKRNCSTGNTQDCHGNEYSEKPCHLQDCSN
ncbi:uncharacterized protein LOC132740563 isoform X2 [Ruditapes philippinarum]|uniref:uncharacterized protein LOC132740563 isoform X2 n=1 Tax=Ruditapes philippinarum TaxID=129788 RepID=UPI00295B462D|nr:uncharacterized protein LOC132740563 isoform X2 [Ruditapes philippinarum]